MIKDGLGHLGGVFYAAFISDRFDSEPKRHRLRSVLAMQAASLLELVTPLWPHMFLLIASLSNVGKKHDSLILQNRWIIDFFFLKI